MKPILKAVMEDKPAEATINTIFEDLYNRFSQLSVEIKGEGTLDTPHIDSSSSGTEGNYAFIYLHCIPIPTALLYIWRFRIRGTTRWSHWISGDNETKILNLRFATEYEVSVMALNGTGKSKWSYSILVMSAASPVPSTVTGITATNAGLYVDPTTGVTLASVKVEWDTNADSELVDAYEVLWTEV